MIESFITKVLPIIADSWDLEELYEEDDEALTYVQLQSIRQASSASNTPEGCFTHRLF